MCRAAHTHVHVPVHVHVVRVVLCLPAHTRLLDLRVCTASAEGDGGAEDFEGEDRGAGDEGREAKAPGPPRSPLVASASPLVKRGPTHTRNSKPDHLEHRAYFLHGPAPDQCPTHRVPSQPHRRAPSKTCAAVFTARHLCPV